LAKLVTDADIYLLVGGGAVTWVSFRAIKEAFDD
jgi:hypothetical protein